MLGFLPAPVRGALSFLLIVINTLFWTSLLFPLAFLKLIIPIRPWRKFINRLLDGIATSWISVNNANLAITNKIEWDVEGLDDLPRKDWYLVLSNHQSWSDILVLQRVFNRKIPFLKFFIKQDLIYVPVLGLAWWALDYPFMKRYSKEYLEKNPDKKGKDLETTREACEKFRDIPVSVMNFVEGTRFTKEKHEKQESPYRHLLRPRAAGIALVLDAMGDQINTILNVSIAYPNGVQGLWGFISGKADKVRVRVTRLPAGDNIRGDYFNDPIFRQNFHEWLNTLWDANDECMDGLLSARPMV